MNIRQIRQILKDTDFIHTSGTPEERRVAEYLAERCRELGAETRLEAFPVEMAEVQTSRLLADGREIPCKGYRCCGSGTVEAELCYLPNTDPASAASVRRIRMSLSSPLCVIRQILLKICHIYPFSPHLLTIWL